MTDDVLRRVAKGAALGLFRVNLWSARGWARLRGQRPYALGGACGACARCCEEPSIRANAAVWYLPTLRSSFLWWQEKVNGFVLVRREPRQKVFVFRCSHFDASTRRCDSYRTRPGMCRDYPRGLLQQPRPEFLEGCGYRAVDPAAKRLLRVLEARDLPPEQLEKLKTRLYLRD
jgi:uncharacterized protein